MKFKIVYMMIAIFFILGLIIGSFLNVVISRLRTLETILGRSLCRHCRKQIRWYDNIPLLSFVVLRARCRDCGEKISWQYPLVEGMTGALFSAAVAVFFRAGDAVSWGETALVLGVIAVSTIIFWYDLASMEIPMAVVWMGIIFVILVLMWLDWAEFSEAGISSVFSLHLYEGLLSGMGAFLFFFLLASLSRERWMGMGDAFVALFMGIVLGWPGIFLAILMAFGLGSVVGVALIAARHATMKSKVPFAPYLVSSLVAVLFIEKIFPYWGRYLNVW